MSEYLMGDIVQVFNYDEEACNLCGLCVSECEFNALLIHNDKLFFNPCRCRRCESCDECPTGAMRLEMFTINEKPKSEKEKQERWWMISGSCVVSCDGGCGECQR